MSGEARFFIVREDKVLVPTDRLEITAFTAGDWLQLQAHAATILPLDKGPGSSDFAVELDPDFEAGEGFEWMRLRRLVGRVADAEFDAWGKAAQLLHWHRTHRYCGRCGQATIAHASEQAMVCPACSLSWYPRISPCVIVLVTRGEDLLLARSPRFQEGMYSTLAGFVEPGESVETAVHREIGEEVAIRVGGLRYFGSQPWPFPGQLMLGFLAEYAGGEIEVDGVEISDAAWYHYRRLPLIPGPGTIAGRMIRHYRHLLDGEGPGAEDRDRLRCRR